MSRESPALGSDQIVYWAPKFALCPAYFILAEIANHLARTLLYGVGIGNAAEMLFALAVLVLGGPLAALIPARRARVLDRA
jgi:hypothetical protein